MRGERRVRTHVVLARLVERNLTVYESWSCRDLAGSLAEHGLDVVKSGGVKVIRADDITGQASTETAPTKTKATSDSCEGLGGDDCQKTLWTSPRRVPRPSLPA